MSEHFTPQGPYTVGGNFTNVNANNIETGIGAVDNAKVDADGTTPMTGALEISQALGGFNKVVQRWVATDGKTYALLLTATNGLRISNITDNLQIIEFGPTAITAAGFTVWTANNDGAGSGMDADKLDGLDSGNGSGNIPISNGTLNTNLNADLLDGLDSLAFARLASAANFTSSLQKSGKDVVFAQAGLTGKFSAQTTAPTSPADGDLWLDTSVVLG